MRKFWVILFLIIIIILILGIVFAIIDYQKVKQEKKPIFCLKQIVHEENGKEYIGLGYKIMKYPEESSKEEKIQLTTLFINYNNPNSDEKTQYSKTAQLYIKLIDNLMKTDVALNDDMQYMAIDFTTFIAPLNKGEDETQLSSYPKLSQKDCLDIMKYCEKYHLKVMNASLEDLQKQGLFHEDTNSIDGVLLSVVSVQSFTENQANFRMSKYRGGLGAIMPNYIANYLDEEWTIEVSDEMIA